MGVIKKILVKTHLFLALYGIFLLIGLVYSGIYPKGTLNLVMNIFHNNTMDYIARIMTVQGDGIYIVLFCAFIFVHRRALSLAVFASYLLSGGIAQVLKRMIDLPRPKAVLSNLLIYTPNIEVHSIHSMPSGHTVSAFAMMLIVSYISKNHWISVFCVVWAVLIGLSRIYLQQHFLEDTLAGSAIGVISSLLIILLFETKVPDRFKLRKV